MKKLILFGLEQYPTDSSLLDCLSFLHAFLYMPKEVLARYTLACELENDPEKFHELAQDCDVNTSSFGYDGLQYVQTRHRGHAIKSQIINMVLAERNKPQEVIVF